MSPFGLRNLTGRVRVLYSDEQKPATALPASEPAVELVKAEPTGQALPR